MDIIFFHHTESYTVNRLKETAKKANFKVFSANPLKLSVYSDGILSASPLPPRPHSVFIRGSVGKTARESIQTLCRFYEQRGIPVINPSQGTCITANKRHTIDILNGAKLPTTESAFITDRALLGETARLLGGYPIIVKFLYGCAGVGIIPVENETQLLCIFDALKATDTSFFLEHYYREASEGTLRMLIAKEKVIASYLMYPPKNDFRSNLAKGGKAEKYLPERTVTQIALKAFSLSGLFWGSLDIILTQNGPVILEINSSPGIEAAEKLYGRGIASQIIETLL